MSLRWKIAVALASITSIATVALGAANYRTTSQQLIVEIDRSLIALDARIGDRPGAQDIPDRGPFSAYEAQFVQADGTITRSTFTSPLPVDREVLAMVGAVGRSRFSDVFVDGEHFRVRTVGLQRGVLQVARSLEETDRVLAALRLRTLLWTFGVIALSIGAGWWIASSVTASLRRLTAAAERVGTTGELDVGTGESGTDEVGRLSGAFDRMLAALRRSRDEQQRLVEDAGHELRTPLTSLRTNLDALQRYPSMNEEDRAAILADLQAETHELTDLVNEVVAVASGAQSDEPFEPVDLAVLAQRVAERFERRSGRPVEVVGGPSPVVGQAAGLQRAISCLVDNACKFDATGGPIRIEVGGGSVVVVDRGPGIPESELDAVFERFHRAPDARTMAGSGLGLSIVREVARRHGGEATATSGAGGGARVGFHVPAP